jgi:hypothetical protein
MKIVIRTLVFHYLCIIGFTFIYFYIQEHFSNIDKTKMDMLDFFLFSTTIQAGIGDSHIYPTAGISKIIMIVQQILLISTHVVSIYFFTL